MISDVLRRKAASNLVEGRNTLPKRLSGIATHRRQMMSPTFFAAFMIPVAIVIHMSSELVSFGPYEFSSSMLARHVYLFVAGIAALCTGVALSGIFASADVRRRRLALIVTGLPFRGGGTGFLTLCFLTQATLFIGSQAVEGCPIAGGNFFSAVLSAFLLCVIAALVMNVLPRRVVAAITEIYLVRRFEHGADRCRLTPQRFLARSFAPIVKIYQAVVGNRPPPIFAA